MTCRFLENLTLRSLVAPVTVEEFKGRYWEQKPLIVHRGDPDYYGDLFTLQDFDEAITRDPNYVKIANAATKKNQSYKSASVPGLEAVLADMRDGSTLVLDQLHLREPKLGLLCRLLGPELGHRFQTNLYLTPPLGKGFTPHWDNHDVFIMQVMGSKHWKIEKERRVVPLKGDTLNEEDRELRGDIYSFTLEQGDIIYIPRGFVHAAECGPTPSLHITLGVTAIFFEDLLHAIIRASLKRDERLRVALPIGFMEDGLERLASRAKAALKDACDDAFLHAVVDEFRDEMVKTFPIDVSGQILEFFQPAALTVNDIVGPRRGMVYQTHVTEDTVRLNFGTRTIVFPLFFRDALDFALNIPVFAIGKLPGEIEDEERVVFVERLIQEGLIVRK
jgi:ribosomal protein L16 Arg81 hydroxylase